MNINKVRQQRESNTQPRFDFETRAVSGVTIATGLDNFIALRPRRFRQTFPASNDPNDLIYRGTVKELALFVQDKIKVSDQFDR